MAKGELALYMFELLYVSANFSLISMQKKVCLIVGASGFWSLSD